MRGLYSHRPVTTSRCGTGIRPHQVVSARALLRMEGAGPLLELIDECLESFLRATVPLSATDIDVAFDAPDREWSAKLTRPTINVFLWDIRRSASRSSAGVRAREVDGTTVRRPVPPMLELRYVLTAWTSDLGDERALLAGLLRSLLAHGEVPREYLGDPYDGLEPPTLAIARSGEDHMDVFKALEGPATRRSMPRSSPRRAARRSRWRPPCWEWRASTARWVACSRRRTSASSSPSSPSEPTGVAMSSGATCPR